MLGRSSSGWPQSWALWPLGHAGLSKGSLSVISRVLQNVPDCRPRPDRPAGSGSLASFLQAPTDFAEAAAFQGNPLEYLLHNSGLLRDGFKSGLPPAFMDGDVPISEGRAGHHVQRAALGRVLFATAASFHDLGPLVLRHDPLHLQEQVVFGALAERPVQEHDLDTRATPLVDQQDLVRVITCEPVRRMHVDAIDRSCSGKIAQPIERRTNKRGPAVTVIDELPF